jgi:hypothetical protein
MNPVVTVLASQVRKIAILGSDRAELQYSGRNDRKAGPLLGLRAAFSIGHGADCQLSAVHCPLWNGGEGARSTARSEVGGVTTGARSDKHRALSFA